MKSALIQWNARAVQRSVAARRPLVRPLASCRPGDSPLPPSCWRTISNGSSRSPLQRRRQPGQRALSAVAVAEESAADGSSTTSSSTANKNAGAGAAKSRLSKCLTREVLRTRKTWMALDDNFGDIKEALEEEFQVTYGADATTLRCRFESSNSGGEKDNSTNSTTAAQSSSLATYLQIVCSTADTALIQESAEAARESAAEAEQEDKKEPKGTVKIDRSEGEVKIEYRPPGMDYEKDVNAERAREGLPRVLGITFQVRVGKIGADGKQLDSALLVDCGMDVCDSEIHILHVDYEYGGGGSSNSDNSSTSRSDSRKVSVSHKFRNPTETYEGFQKFLSQHCGIDENVAKFLMNFNIFRRQQNKLKFLQGVKSLLE